MNACERKRRWKWMQTACSFGGSGKATGTQKKTFIWMHGSSGCSLISLMCRWLRVCTLATFKSHKPADKEFYRIVLLIFISYDRPCVLCDALHIFDVNLPLLLQLHLRVFFFSGTIFRRHSLCRRHNISFILIISFVWYVRQHSKHKYKTGNE